MGTSTEVKSILSARKNHFCKWCAEQIAIGEPYKKYRWYYGNDAVTVKMHPECLDASNKLVIIEGGPIEFYPGENPRGCICGFCKSCGCWLKSKAKQEKLDQQL